MDDFFKCTPIKQLCSAPAFCQAEILVTGFQHPRGSNLTTNSEMKEISNPRPSKLESVISSTPNYFQEESQHLNLLFAI